MTHLVPHPGAVYASLERAKTPQRSAGVHVQRCQGLPVRVEHSGDSSGMDGCDARGDQRRG